MRKVSHSLALGIFTLVSLVPLLALSQTASKSAHKPNKIAPKIVPKAHRSSRLDLEVAGNLAGFFPGSKRYLRRADLLALPQVNFTVTDDANFAGPTKIRGVELELLAHQFSSDGEAAVVVAVCDDWYRAYYPHAYREAHKPVLALEINGQPPSAWPKSKEGASMGPYLITHPSFAPGFKILSHEEEPQIPWGVIRLDFTDEKTAFDPIAPHGPNAESPDVQAGFRIAQQNCLRCHSATDERTKGTITWSALGVIAERSPRQFMAYVKDPKDVSDDAQMPPNPNYDDATLQALTAYFRTFAPAPKQ